MFIALFVSWYLKTEACHDCPIHFCPFLRKRSGTFASGPAYTDRIDGKYYRYRPHFPGGARGARRLIVFQRSE